MATSNKYFVFSDESGSWHDPREVYVRAWVVVHESSYDALVEAMSNISTDLKCNEVRWKILANNPSHFDVVEKFDYRVFLTVSSPADIKWERKYRITRDFPTQIQNLDFGEIDEALSELIKKKMFDDIKYVLFLNFYEKTHIENAKEGIERVLPKRENLLIYRVDPPQMSKDGWKSLLHTISPGVEIEFPKSQSDPGIQFADVIAGCVKSFLVEDDYLDQSKILIPKFREKLIPKHAKNPNPNLIFFKEINEKLKIRTGELWKIPKSQ